MNLAAQQHILALFEATKNGELTLTHYPENGSEEYTVTYDMTWDRQAAEVLAKQFEALCSALHRMGMIHAALKDQEFNRELLTPEQFGVWQTYLAPFAQHDFDEAQIAQLQMAVDLEDVTTEDAALLKAYHDWYEKQCLQRLPFLCCSPIGLICRARRYEKLVSLAAPRIIQENELRCLAEEMALYHYMARE